MILEKHDEEVQIETSRRDNMGLLQAESKGDSARRRLEKTFILVLVLTGIYLTRATVKAASTTPSEVYIPPYAIPATKEQWVIPRVLGGEYPASLEYVMGVTTGHSASQTLSWRTNFENCPHVSSQFEQ